MAISFLIGPLVTQLRYMITFLDCKLTAHRWDSVPKGEFARLHPLETPSDVFSNTSYTCLISQASIAIEIGDRLASISVWRHVQLGKSVEPRARSNEWSRAALL